MPVCKLIEPSSQCLQIFATGAGSTEAMIQKFDAADVLNPAIK